MRPGIFRAAATLILAALLSACAAPPRQPLQSLSDAKQGEVIIVGRVELLPPLTESQKQLPSLGAGWEPNMIYVIIGDTYRRLKGEPTLDDYAGRIEATLGKDFTVRSSSKPFYILSGVVAISTGSGEAERTSFPGGLEVPIRPDDKAVYIGTMRYYHNEFMDITKMVLVDDYARANAEFKKTFGANFSLRKALVRPVK